MKSDLFLHCVRWLYALRFRSMFDNAEEVGMKAFQAILMLCLSGVVSAAPPGVMSSLFGAMLVDVSAVAAAMLVIRFVLFKFSLMRRQLALEREVSDAIEVSETGFPSESSEMWASPGQMVQHCARCGGEPVFDPGMFDWTCPSCGATNEGGQDLDPNDPDNYDEPEDLRGGFDDYDNGYRVVAPERCGTCGNTTFEEDEFGDLRCTNCDDRVKETYHG